MQKLFNSDNATTINQAFRVNHRLSTNMDFSPLMYLSFSIVRKLNKMQGKVVGLIKIKSNRFESKMSEKQEKMNYRIELWSW